MVALGLQSWAKANTDPAAGSWQRIKRNARSGLILLDGKVVIRTAPRNLGTRAIVHTRKGLEIQNSRIIPYNTDLPAKKTRDDYRLTVNGQAYFDVPVVEFDDISPEVILQTYRFECPQGLPQGTLSM